MTIQVNVGEAKARLSELIARVEKGQEVIIARDNQPVVRLVLEQPDRVRAAEAVARIRELRRKMAPTTLEEILSWRHEGHKY
ncbi:MAG: type II toxin-antitoxin system Phd/YefM family antitoxin [Parvularculaceae bacterium]